MYSQPWTFQQLEIGNNKARQFEFHPTIENTLLCGTIHGDVLVLNSGNGSSGIIRHYHGNYAAQNSDAILGLCWFKTNPDRFISGSAHGTIRCGNWRAESDSLDCSHSQSIVSEYPVFGQLTSVHVNCTDERLLVSGYARDVYIYDVITGQTVHRLQQVHQDNINISRFANHSPALFATSSFDRTAKVWDTRTPMTEPIYTVQSEKGLIMLSFSPDDNFLLASAVDNEVTQYLTVDGSMHMRYKIPRTTMEGNFTRAYYSATGAYVFAGASEEPVINVLCSRTGELVARTEMFPERKHSSLYVQSLRGDTHDDKHLCVLVNYRDIADRDILSINLATPQEGTNENRPSMSTNDTIEDVRLPSSRLARDLHEQLLHHEHTDLTITAHGESFDCHAFIVAARSSIIAARIPECCGEATARRVDLSDLISPNAAELFMIVLRYLYTDDVMVADLRRSCIARLRLEKDIEAMALEELNIATAHAMDAYAYDASSFELSCAWLDDRCDQRELRWHSIWAPWYLQACEDVLSVAESLQLLRLQSIMDDLLSRFIMGSTISRVCDIASKYQREKLMEHCRAFVAARLDFLPNLADVDEDLVRSAMQLRQSNQHPAVSLPHDGDGQTARWYADMDVPAIDKIPSFSGYGACALDHNVLLIGGKDNDHFHSLRCIYSVNLETQAWCRVETFGPVPGRIFCPTAGSLEKTSPRHVFLCEGRRVAFGGRQSQSSVYLLDTLTMMWQIPDMMGESPSGLSYHSMACLYTEDMHELSQAVAPRTREFSPAELKYSSRSATISPYLTNVPNDRFSEDLSLSTRFIVFGGLLGGGPSNSVHILAYHRKALSAPSTLDENHPPFYSHGFVWIQPQVLGHPPAPRYLHSAGTVHFSLSNGGPRMIVFAGVGSDNVYNDLACLRISDLRSVRWEPVQVEGTRPPSGYNHAMTKLPNRNSFLVMGGIAFQRQSESVYLLDIDATSHSVTARWTELTPQSPAPVLRIEPWIVAHKDAIFVVGGSGLKNRSEAEPLVCKVQLALDSLRFVTEACSSYVSTTSFNPVVNRRVPTLHADLHDAFLKELFGDTTLVIPSSFDAADTNSVMSMPPETIIAHKVVLSARSAIFRAMLQSAMIEAATSRVTIQDVEFPVLQAFLTYLYTDTVRCSPDDLVELLTLANRYTLQRLVQFCEGLLTRAIDDGNCFDLLVLADDLALRTLAVVCSGYVVRRWQTVTTPEKLDSLSQSVRETLEGLRNSRTQAYAFDAFDGVVSISDSL